MHAQRLRGYIAHDTTWFSGCIYRVQYLLMWQVGTFCLGLLQLSDDKCRDLSTGTFGVLLQFGFGTDSTRKWVARQVVPPTWILSGVEVRVDDGSGQKMVKA